MVLDVRDALFAAAQGYFTDAHGTVHPLGERDPHGRFPSGGPIPAVAERAERPLLADLKKLGGFTFQTHLGSRATAGYAVSPYSQHEKVFHRPVSVADLHSYMAAHDDLLSKDDHNVGAWLDKKTGITYLDVSIVKDTPEEAESTAKQFDQEAYYDFAKDQSVYVNARIKQGRYDQEGRDGRGASGSARRALWQSVSPRWHDIAQFVAPPLTPMPPSAPAGFFKDRQGSVHPIFEPKGPRTPVPNAEAWRQALTPEQRRAVRRWGDGSGDIRDAARGVSRPYFVPMDDPAKLANDFQTALHSAPAMHGTIYRGLSSLSDQAFQAITTAKAIKSRAPASFTTHPDLVGPSPTSLFGHPGGKGLHVVVFSADDHDAGDVSSLTSFPNEAEGVVPKNSVYTVEHVDIKPYPGVDGSKLARIKLKLDRSGSAVADPHVQLAAQPEGFFHDAQGKVHPLMAPSGGSTQPAGGDAQEFHKTTKTPSVGGNLLKRAQGNPTQEKANVDAFFKEAGIGHDVMVKNLLSIYDRTPPKTLEEGKDWYKVAQGIAKNFSEEFGTNERLVIGVIAAISPNMEWNRNIVLAHNVLKLVNGEKTFTITQGHADHAKDEDLQSLNPLRRANPLDLTNYNGKDMSLKGQNFVGVHNVSDLPPEILSRTHPLAGGMFHSNAIKAIRIARGEDPDVVLSGPKVRSFFNSMFMPDNKETGTIDTHMARAMTGNLGLTNKQYQVLTGDPTHYRYMDDAMNDAAKQRGIDRNGFQGAIWTQWRIDHPRSERSKVTRNQNKAKKAKMTKTQSGALDVYANPYQGDDVDPDWIDEDDLAEMIAADDRVRYLGIASKHAQGGGHFFRDSQGRIHPVTDTTQGHSFPDKFGDLKHVGDLGGSTGAQLMADSAGHRYVVKRGNSPAHIENEMAANAAYQALGVPVPAFKRYETVKGPAQVAEYVSGTTLGQMPNQRSAREALKPYFAAHALLANWDAHGLSNDNVIFAGGNVARPLFVDNGGALEFRAQGAPKATFDGKVREFDTLRDPGMNPTSAAVFGDLSTGEIRSQVHDLEANKDALLGSLPPDIAPIVASRLGDLKKRTGA